MIYSISIGGIKKLLFLYHQMQKLDSFSGVIANIFGFFTTNNVQLKVVVNIAQRNNEIMIIYLPL